MESAEEAPANVDTIIWSYSHWDHTGYPDKFPNASLVVGPGRQAAVRPGWPVNPEAHVFESDFTGCAVRETAFPADAPRIAGLPAHDFFGDGSLYLLDIPGHCTGHMVGLARAIASLPSFMLLGGDTAHYIGLLRPSAQQPLPSHIPLPRGLGACACDAPLLALPGADGADSDLGATRRTHAALQALDAQGDVLLLLSLDGSADAQLPFFPADANGWCAAGVKNRTRWAFLEPGSTGNRWAKA